MAKRRLRAGERALLDGLSGDESRRVLEEVVRSVAGAGEIVERVAADLLGVVSVESVAGAVEKRLRSMPHTDLASRSGRLPGRGYVEPTEAAWELLEEAVEPWIADIERRGRLGSIDSASVVMTGVVTGLRRCQPAPESTVLDWATDAPRELAEEVVRGSAAAGAEVDLAVLAAIAADCFDRLG